MSNFLKEYRCQNCHKLFFKGNLQYAAIEIKCQRCKKINIRQGTICKLWILADEQGLYKRKDGSYASSDNTINNAMIECEGCEKASDCGHYQDMKNKEICPLCKNDLK